MEIYKDVKGYEGLYQVSNYGNVKSFVRSDGRILKPGLGGVGYLLVVLYKNEKGKSKNVHQLVAESFLNHTPCGMKLVVNHIDFDKTNNHVSNLEIVTNRENTNKKHIKSSSKYIGVGWDKSRQKWVSRIRINGKLKQLGRFSTEIEASEAYQNKRKTL